ncbi:MAG TPA: hypothetical protein VFB45_02495 [Pseudolabrys sp.]|nr:hypothetical protein [Pseudolabrys sp.]
MGHKGASAARGLVRVEVQTRQSDARLIRNVAAALRGEGRRATRLRSALASALADREVKTAFDIFGSDPPYETFAGVFDQPRQKHWREIDL